MRDSIVQFYEYSFIHDGRRKEEKNIVLVIIVLVVVFIIVLIRFSVQRGVHIFSPLFFYRRIHRVSVAKNNRQ